MGGEGVTLQGETPAAYCLTMLVEAIYYAEYAPPPRGDEAPSLSPLPGRGEAPSWEGRSSLPGRGEAPSWEGRGSLHGSGEAPFLGEAKLRPCE